MQIESSYYTRITNFEKSLSLSKLPDKILLSPNQLAADNQKDGNRIYHAKLVETVLASNLEPKPSSFVDVHEGLRYLLENDFLYQIEDCATIFYTRHQLSRASVYEITEKDRKKMVIEQPKEHHHHDHHHHRHHHPQKPNSILENFFVGDINRRRKRKHSSNSNSDSSGREKNGSSFLRTKSQEVQT